MEQARSNSPLLEDANITHFTSLNKYFLSFGKIPVSNCQVGQWSWPASSTQHAFTIFYRFYCAGSKNTMCRIKSRKMWNVKLRQSVLFKWTRSISTKLQFKVRKKKKKFPVMPLGLSWQRGEINPVEATKLKSLPWQAASVPTLCSLLAASTHD